MRCGSRSLSLVSLGFGLVATGALSLAVATDYWLFTVEPVPVPPASLNANDSLSDGVDAGVETDSMEEVDESDDEPVSGPSREDAAVKERYHQPLQPQQKHQQQYHQQRPEALQLNASSVVAMLPPEPEFTIRAHSGLWRLCIVHDEPDEGFPPQSCSSIGYFSQSWGRVEGADTTTSIIRAIRKSSPAILGSLLLLLTALTLSIVGTTKNDFKIIVSAIIYIFSALSLGMGVILYISSVNDEVAHRKKQPDSGSDGKSTFSYEYGWAFFFGGATFVCAMGAAVSNISLYLRRYSHFDDTLFIVTATANSGGMAAASVADNNGIDCTGYQPIKRADGNRQRGTAEAGHASQHYHPQQQQRHFYEYSGGLGVGSTRWPTYEARKSFESCRSIHATPDYGLTIPL